MGRFMLISYGGGEGIETHQLLKTKEKVNFLTPLKIPSFGSKNNVG